MGRSLSLKKKEVFHLCFRSHLLVSLSSSHQVFLNWNRSLSLKRKPSLSELSPHFKASLSAHQVFLSEENHQSLSMSLSLKKPSLSPIFFFWKKKSKSFVTINVFLIKEIPVFHNPGIIICYGKEKKSKQQPRNELHERKKAQATIKLNIQIV